MSHISVSAGLSRSAPIAKTVTSRTVPASVIEGHQRQRTVAINRASLPSQGVVEPWCLSCGVRLSVAAVSLVVGHFR